MYRETKQQRSKVGACTVFMHQDRGYDSPDTWYTVEHDGRKVGRDFGDLRDAEKFASNYLTTLSTLTRTQKAVYQELTRKNATSKDPLPIDVGDIKSRTVFALAEKGLVDVGHQYHKGKYRVVCWLTYHRVIPV